MEGVGIWDGVRIFPDGTPIVRPARIGIYDGTRSASLPDPDAHTSGWIGHIPPIASSYYNGAQLAHLGTESTRLGRGTHAVVTHSIKSGPVDFDDLAEETSQALDWVDARAERVHELSNVNPDAKIYVSFESEFESKKASGEAHVVGVPNATYAAALDVWHTRMASGAPKAIRTWWTSGASSTAARTNVTEVLAAMTVTPQLISLDPYRGPGRPHDETFTESAGPKVAWLRANSDFIRLGSPPLAITEVGTDRSHGDASVAAFINSIRPGLIAMDLKFALWFNRDSGPNNNCKLDGMGMPLSIAALAAQFPIT